MAVSFQSYHGPSKLVSRRNRIRWSAVCRCTLASRTWEHRIAPVSGNSVGSVGCRCVAPWFVCCFRPSSISFTSPSVSTVMPGRGARCDITSVFISTAYMQTHPFTSTVRMQPRPFTSTAIVRTYPVTSAVRMQALWRLTSSNNHLTEHFICNKLNVTRWLSNLQSPHLTPTRPKRKQKSSNKEPDRKCKRHYASQTEDRVVFA